MKIYPLMALAASLLPILAAAQAAPSQQDLPHSDFAVVARLTKDLNAGKLKLGDKISAKVIQDVVVEGRVLIPRDSKLFGHVVEVMSFSKDDPRSRLALLFDQEENKRERSTIHGVIQAIAPPLPDPFLDAIMGASSSSYSGRENGHPVNGGTSTGQTNEPTPIVTSGSTRNAAGALKQRERELEKAGSHSPEAVLPGGTLSSANHGVFGLPGMFLAGTAPIPAILAVGQNVELKSGTQIVLRLTGGLLNAK